MENNPNAPINCENGELNPQSWPRECLDDGSDCGHSKAHYWESCEDQFCTHPNCKTADYPVANIEKLKSGHVVLLEALQTIADFAVGNGDVCEIIAKRARAAIQQAERT